jgi:Family of unknown function (DUF5519)
MLGPGNARAASARASAKNEQRTGLRLLYSYPDAMSDDLGDVLWEAFVIAMLATGPAVERRSRYGDKPALFTASREIAHLEAPGIIDLRITRAGWSQVRDRFDADPAVRRDPSRRDWIELHLGSAADLDRLGALLAAAIAANA